MKNNRTVRCGVCAGQNESRALLLERPRSKRSGDAAEQTPDEAFFGIGDEGPKMLAVARKTAREKRIEENRAARCGVRVGETTSGALLSHRPRSSLL